MTIQQLEYIVAVDEYGHFGNAAQACGVTQPTLSLMVKKLEEELDVILFDRDAYPIRATDAGRKVIDKASVVLYNVRQLRELTRTEKELASGNVDIGMLSTVAPVLAPGIFSYMLKKHPAVTPQIEEMLSTTIIEKLHRAEIDMGITVSPVEDPDLLEIPIYHERFLAYVSPSHPLHNEKAIRSGEILDHHVWIMKNGLRRFDRSMLAPGEKFCYERMYEGGRAGTLIHLVNEIGGLTVVPELHARLLLYSMHANLRPLVDPEVERSISIVIRKDYVHEEMLNIVIDAIRNSVPTANQSEMVRRGRLTL